MDYISRYAITPEKLKQRYIDGDLQSTTLDAFPSWLNRRAEALAAAANDYLASLRGDLKLPAAAPSDVTAEHAYAVE